MYSSMKQSVLYISLVSCGIFASVEAVAVKPRSSGPIYPGLSSLHARQNNGTQGNSTFTPVVGCKGGPVDRREITELQNEDPDVFNMFLLALRDVHDDMENEDTSWYQLAGIHGFPYEEWQEDAGFVPPNPNRGYCTHRSAIFTTWHRPYLILLEQLLCEKARSIGDEFEGYAAVRWREAAEKVRLPYWDWSSSTTESRIPESVKATTVSVTTPNGQDTIENPLFNYDFLNPQPPSSGLGAETVRGTSDDDLADGFDNRKQATLNLFTVDEYNQFSRDLESIHDWIHVGVGGDMGFVPTSAFDPIFFLHHANVDRLMAMYQATHPGVTLTPARRSPTFALGGGGQDDLNTRLYPFRHEDLSGWTSNDVADAESIFTYGYSYPEVPQGLSPAELSAFTTEKVNELYGVDSDDDSLQANEKSGKADTTDTRIEWTCNVQANTEGLVGSYRIRIYVGSSDGDVQNYAGAAAIFANADTAVDNPNDLLNASVPLTPTLLDKDISLNANETVSVLADELSWVVERRTDAGVDFEEVDASEIGDSLVISVVSNEAKYPSDKSSLPSKGEPITYYAPTVGKTGGLQEGDEVKVGTKSASDNSTISARRMRERTVRLW